MILFSERLNYLLRLLGKSQVKFAEELGISSQNLNAVIKGNRGLAEKHIQKIIDIYPNIDYLWLKLGKGEPPVFQNQPSKNTVNPIYSNFSPKPVYAMLPKKSEPPEEPDELQKIIGYMDLVEFNFKKCSEYLKVRDNAMQSEASRSYPDGCIIGMEPMPKGIGIVFGKPYVLKMKNQEVHFRLIRSNEDEKKYTLQPINERQYDNMVVLLEDIEAIFKARGPITIKDEHY